MQPKTKRRFDPDRRTRIIDAALDVIVERGVAGTSHRLVAAKADVPLGSMTYHFDGLEDLLNAAFERFTQSMAAFYRARLEAAISKEQACGTVVDLLCADGGWPTEHNMILTYELYAYAIRQPRLRPVWVSWMSDSSEALERFFSPQIARALDAVIVGIAIQNFAHANKLSREEIVEIIRRLTS